MKTESEPFTIAAFEAGLKDNQWVQTSVGISKVDIKSVTGRREGRPILAYMNDDISIESFACKDLQIITEVQPREWWIVIHQGFKIGMAYDSLVKAEIQISDCNYKDSKIIHVREVIE